MGWGNTGTHRTAVALPLVAFVVAVVATGGVTAATTTEQPLNVGDSIQISEQTIGYLDGTKVEIDAGVTGTITTGPTEYEGETWYEVDLMTRSGEQSFWVRESAVDAYEGEITPYTTPAPKFEEGESVVVAERTEGWKGESKVVIDSGLRGETRTGGITYNGRYWYEVQTNSGKFWIVEGALDESQTPFRTTTERSPAFSKGDNVKVTVETTGWQNQNRVTVPEGIIGKVKTQPTDYRGAYWYKIQTNEGVYWVGQPDLTETDEPVPTPSLGDPEYKSGDWVKVVKNANIYQNGRWTRIQPGPTGKVTGEPYQFNNGYWYKVQGETGSFWIGESAIVPYAGGEQTGASPPQFKVGDRIKLTSETVAFNNNSEISLSKGVTGTVIYGPTWWDRQTWYVIENDAGQFWVPEWPAEGLDGETESADIEQGTQHGYDLDEVERRFLKLLNEERESRDKQRVQRRGILAHMGHDHSRDMANRGYIAHTAPDDDSATDRYREYGLMPQCNLPIEDGRYFPGAENIAQTHVDRRVESEWAPNGSYKITNESDFAWALFTMWMKSPPHKQAMLVHSADQAGLGIHINRQGVVYASLELC